MARRPTQRVFWTREMSLAALHRFMDEHGRQPTMREVMAGAVKLGIPSHTTLQRIFGSWNAAMVAAGGVARRPGEYPRPPRKPRPPRDPERVARLKKAWETRRRNATSPVNEASRPSNGTARKYSRRRRERAEATAS